MSASITATNLTLTVPSFVQTRTADGRWFNVILAEAFSRSRREYRTILDGLNFSFNDGDRVALLGRNGAGKTTLLRVLSGAFEPTSGDLSVHGSRQALLNLGLGFNAQASVRENVFLRAAAMGIPLREAEALADSIFEFAGLADVAQHRLATLSSGQRMRLGFAISTSIQNDIMLMDEWFGAGDAGFVERARQRLSDRVGGARILVLASHNFQMLRKVCTQGLVLEQGKQVFFGPVEDAIVAYKKIYQAEPAYIEKRKQEQAALCKGRSVVDSADPKGLP